MSTHVLAAAWYSTADLRAKTATSPEFRRATHNQLMAYEAVRKVLEQFPRWDTLPKGSVGMVVGTSHGELDTTVTFLKDLSLAGTARPLLFQNSLHNATLGFLTKHFSMTGPGITVSQCEKTGSAAIETAEILLQSMVTHCIVVGVDGFVSQVEGSFRAMYPKGKTLSEGAGALLLSKAEGIPLSDIKMQKTELMYDSQLIESLAKAYVETLKTRF